MVVKKLGVKIRVTENTLADKVSNHYFEGLGFESQTLKVQINIVDLQTHIAFAAQQ